MCGLIAVTGTVSSAYDVFGGLLNLQHRGQDGAGILAVDSKRKNGFQLLKGSGLVENVFSERSFKTLRGTAALGHTRYATIGRNDPNLLQPFLDYESGIGLAHNGNIVNFYELREELFQSDKNQPWLESDSALILRLLSNELKNKEINADTAFAAIEKVMNKLAGSYAVACVTSEGHVFGFRDPHAIRPLVMGRKETEDGDAIYALCSETVALDFLDYTSAYELAPGEAVFIDVEGQLTTKRVKSDSFSPCMFEWVYFARVESELSGTPVYDARFKLGTLLAEEVIVHGVEADVVVPVPETSRIAAIALAEALNLPFRELLIKNRYINRTFILDDQQTRQEAIRRKLFPISSEFQGKRCLVVDDSIVRGNTAKQIVRLIRQAGAAEVVLVSSCPPIANPCYYGIDFPSANELVAHEKTEEEIAEELGADKVIFQTVEGLKRALAQQTLCTGCLTNQYPTPIDSGLQFAQKRQKDRKVPASKKS